ncbi:2018_t:CDS:2 [Funneliformis caledonium]|uniref:2018_t:CDS:1 n=1 Tax=Funneliformis caledonium TaxID=1117310 RepID=A0A9N9GZS6_9GLOM|nr:2018_t:CDS:2 [Funneliformis caledonium]
MNANTFLSNISTSLRLLETKTSLIEKANITELTTLIQQQKNSVNDNITSLESIIEQLKRRKFKSIDDLLIADSESKVINKNHNNNKVNPNPYDLTPTLVALIRSKMKANEQDDKDSNENMNFEEKILIEESIHQICYTYFGTRRNIFKTSPEKLKTKKINSCRNNRTLKKFQMRRDIIDTLDTKKLGYLIKEVKALFAQELISPEISEDEDTLFDINTILSNTIDSDSEPEFTSRDARIYRDDRNSKQSTVDSYDMNLAISALNTNFTELPENFEDDLMKSLNNIDEQCATLFSIDPQYIIDSHSDISSNHEIYSTGPSLNPNNMSEQFLSYLAESDNSIRKQNDNAKIKYGKQRAPFKDKTNDDIMKLTNPTKIVERRKLNMKPLSKDKTNDVSNFTKLTEPLTKTIK